MDIVDAAQSRESEIRDQAIANMRARSGIQSASASECQECGDTIPEKRRAAIKGVIFCIGCQEDREG